MCCEPRGGSGSVHPRVKYNDRLTPGVASTGMGWWRHGPDGAPDLSVNLNGATSYRLPWDEAMGAPNTHGIPGRLVPLTATAGGRDPVAAGSSR